MHGGPYGEGRGGRALESHEAGCPLNVVEAPLELRRAGPALLGAIAYAAE